MWLSRLFRKNTEAELPPHRRWPIRSHDHDSDPDLYRLRIFGAVSSSFELSMEDLRSLPSTEVLADLGAGKGRSARHWVGLDARRLLCSCGPCVEAEWLVIHSDGGYLHRLPVDTLYEGPAVLAYGADGKDLSRSDGGPIRLVLPHLEPWRCAKWVRGLELEVGIPS
jgi:DMSO/TMAO reductase YedYZ molybdopterin-dependent catalytic subunit